MPHRFATAQIVAAAALASLSSPLCAQTVPDRAPAPKVDLDLSLFNLDTPIETLISDDRSRAVLDQDLPGLSTDSNLDKFEKMSLREFQAYTGGQLTDAMLAKVGKDLRAIGD